MFRKLIAAMDGADRSALCLDLSVPAILRAGKTLVERTHLTHVMLKVALEPQYRRGDGFPIREGGKGDETPKTHEHPHLNHGE